MTERVPNPPCPKCNGKMRSSNAYRGARQLKCEDCSYRERRQLADDTPVELPKWDGLVTNPPCGKCNGKMHSSNYRDNSRQLKCIACGNRERRQLGTNNLIPARIYAPPCPVCQSKARRWSNTPSTSNVIKMRCEKDVTHEFIVAKGTLEFIEMLPPRIKKEKLIKEKKERQPRAIKPVKQKITLEERQAIRKQALIDKQAKILTQRVNERAASLASPSIKKEEVKAVRQREKLMREKIEDQREARIQKDPLFDFD